MRALVVAWLTVLTITPVASAQRPVPVPHAPPTSADAFEPAVNEDDFPDFPPNWAQLRAEAGKGHSHAGDRARAMPAAVARARAERRSARSATRPGLVTCGGSGWISMQPPGAIYPTYYYVDAASECAYGQTGGAADLLASQACVDIWAVAGYWSRLGCGSWATGSATNFQGAPLYRRDCTYGRYYRPVGKMSMVHGTSAANSYPGAYKRCY